MFVQPVILIQHRCSRRFQRWNASEQIPQTLEMVFHLTCRLSSHSLWLGSKIPSQAPPAMSIASRMWIWAPGICPSLTRKQAAAREARPLPTNVGVLLIYAFWLFRTGKGFVVAVCIVNSFAVFLVFPALSIAVIAGCFFNFFFLDFMFFAAFCCQSCCSCTCCHQCCHT